MKRVILSILLSVFFLCMSSAFAEEMSLVQLESYLEQRMGTLVRSYDPRAQVIVRATLRSQVSALPGMSSLETDTFGSGLLRGVELKDISSIDVTILSSKTTIPDWLKSELNSISTFKNVKAHLNLKMVQELAPEKNFEDRINEGIPALEGFGQKVYFLFLGAFGAFLLMGLFFILRMPKVLNSAIQRLLTGFSEFSQERHPRTDSSPRQKEESFSPRTGGSSSEQSQVAYLSQLSVDGILSLFADCYWSEADAYCSWLWSKFDHAQRQEIMKSLPFAYTYSNYLSTVEPAAKSFHEHPYYLDPLKLELVSNQSFETWLIQQKTKPRQLSPIRQAHVHIPLKTYLDWTKKEESSSKIVSLPKPSEKVRELPLHFGEILITIEDENYIAENHENIAENCRSELLSWVWLWLQPAEVQEQTLSGYSAEDLASAWVGPENILQDLIKHVPERKQRILQDLLQRNQPDRKSWVLAEVTKMVAQRKYSDPNLHQKAA